MACSAPPSSPPQVGREILLELACDRTGRDPARAQAGDDGIDLGLVDVGQGERQEGDGGDVPADWEIWSSAMAGVSSKCVQKALSENG
jgi:hypothetical protein